MGTSPSLVTDSYQAFINSPIFKPEEGFQIVNSLCVRTLKPGTRLISCQMMIDSSCTLPIQSLVDANLSMIAAIYILTYMLTNVV